MNEHEKAPPRAVLVGVQTQGVSPAEFTSSMDELERLASTLGLTVIGRVTQKRGRLATGTVLGEGKLKVLGKWTGGSGEVEKYQKPGSRNAAAFDEDDEETDTHDAYADDASNGFTDGTPDDEASLDDSGEPMPPREPADVVLVDHELTPTQQRNLEKATGVDVLDRTSVILEIFSRHARTREARLQVEIAKLGYLAPRLRESSGGGDRVRGGVGGKGAGETSLELDRRRIRDRIAELRGELSEIEGGRHNRRRRRGDVPTVAMVGYTNAGKSSLMRALTTSEIYVADKLFATLDTTVRALTPRTEPPILVSDTVGFIKNLPHDLVASFRSTLDEAGDADLLLHVLDASDPDFRGQHNVTADVLRDMTDADAPRWLLMNKADKLAPAELAALQAEFPRAIFLSSRKKEDVAALRLRLMEHFAGKAELVSVLVPWDKQRLVTMIHEQGQVQGTTHEENGTTFIVRAPGRLREALEAELGPLPRVPDVATGV